MEIAFLSKQTGQCSHCQKPTFPSLLKPRISWLILDVRPDWISWRCRKRLSRALPRPLSYSPCVSTPRRVLFPASTFPNTASRTSINCNTSKQHGNWEHYFRRKNKNIKKFIMNTIYYYVSTLLISSEVVSDFFDFFLVTFLMVL